MQIYVITQETRRLCIAMMALKIKEKKLSIKVIALFKNVSGLVFSLSASLATPSMQNLQNY